MANAKNKAANKTAKTVKTESKKGAIYTFGGEYYSRTDKGLVKKRYELSVAFPELLQAPLSVFKGGLSNPNSTIFKLMITKYADFSSVRTYSVLHVENNTNTKPKKTDDISIMDIEQLKSYIENNDLGIDTQVFNDDVVKIREIIAIAESDPENFKEVYKQAVESYEYDKKLAELNNTNDDETDETSDNDSDNDVDDLLDDLDGDENGTNE